VTRIFTSPPIAGAALLLAAWLVPSGVPAAGAPASEDKPAPAQGQKPAPAPKAGQAPKPGKPAAGSKQPAAPVALIPKCWDRSIYNLDGRVTTGVSDASFEAPPAYRESFAFWTARMKGGQRTELIQLLTTTREPAEGGHLPFHRQVSRFQVDIMEQGQIKQPAGPLSQKVSDLRWEGTLDRECNLRDIALIGKPDNPDEIDQLSFGLLDRLSPRLGQRRDMKPGDSYTETIAIPLPQRLSVKGLDAIGVILSRTLTLREVHANEAVFNLAVTYKGDPATPPTEPRTTCTIGGGGTGEATFDRTDGLFIRARMESRMTIDLEAPLRRLPDQPEDVDPGTAKSHIDLAINISGTQVVTRLFSEPLVEPGTGAGAQPDAAAPGN
jgi:hypothetical protein